MYPYREPNMSYVAQRAQYVIRVDLLEGKLQRSHIAATRERLIKQIAECIAFRDHLMDLSTGVRSNLIRFTADGNYYAGP